MVTEAEAEVKEWRLRQCYQGCKYHKPIKPGRKYPAKKLHGQLKRLGYESRIKRGLVITTAPKLEHLNVYDCSNRWFIEQYFENQWNAHVHFAGVIEALVLPLASEPYYLSVS